MNSFGPRHTSESMSAFRLFLKSWLLMNFLLNSVLCMLIVLVVLVAPVTSEGMGFLEDKYSLPMEADVAYV